jgi:ACS family hexuronate transporter-like MFS transporter
MSELEIGLSSRTRWTIVGLLAASMTINLIDRQVFAQLAPILTEQFKWSATQYAYTGIAFNLGMMLGQVPAGQFLDRVGTKAGLAFIFIGFSVLTALHAAAGPGTLIDSIGRAFLGLIPGMPVLIGGLAGFIFLRFVLGLFQCGNYTAGIKALAGLFPGVSRSKAGGFFNAGAQLGGALAGYLILTLLIGQLGWSWQLASVVPPIVLLLWLLPWMAVFPNKARMAEIAIKPAAPTGGALAYDNVGLSHLLGHHKVIGLALIRIFTGPITVFYWTWLPLYLRQGRGVSIVLTGVFVLLPALFGMAGNVLGGVLTDRMVTMTGSIDKGRKLGFACAFGLGVLSMALPFVDNNILAVLIMGLALFGNQWVAATYIGTVGDVVPQQLAGRVNGITGLADNGTAMIATFVTGALVDAYGWTPVFIGAGIFPILALLSVVLVMRRIEPAKF